MIKPEQCFLWILAAWGDSGTSDQSDISDGLLDPDL
jgi:hypothetical protein